MKNSPSNLVGLLSLFLLLLGVLDGEVAELVGGLGHGHDTDPVTDVVLLKELLGEVLEVLLGEAGGRSHDDFVLLLLDDHGLAEVTGLPVDLDLGGEESLLQLLKKKKNENENENKNGWEKRGVCLFTNALMSKILS